jgi:chromosome segregation ATPase
MPEMTNAGETTDTASGPPASGPNAEERLRLEQEVRRLQHDLALHEAALRDLAGRLQEAEREAHDGTSRVVDAVRAELSSWQDRCHAAEAELAALRGSKVERVVAPVRELWRLGRKAPIAARKLSRRLDTPEPPNQ